MKIRGAELNLFVNEGWPQPEDDWYWDHDVFDDTADPDVIYDTDELGPILFQGPAGEDPTEGIGYRLDKLIRAWRKQRTHSLVLISIPNEKLEEAMAYLKSIGATEQPLTKQ